MYDTTREYLNHVESCIEDLGGIKDFQIKSYGQNVGSKCGVILDFDFANDIKPKIEKTLRLKTELYFHTDGNYNFKMDINKNKLKIEIKYIHTPAGRYDGD